MITAEMVKHFVAEKINKIIPSSNPSYQKATLASLRRGVGRAPGDLPDIMGELLLDMPDEMQGQSGPSRAEWAAYSALTLFALHQQGHDPNTEPMHVTGEQFGSGVAKLVEGEADRDAAMERIRRRFNQAVTAEDLAKLSYHLRGIVQLMRGKNIPMDYAQLSKDLFQYQNPELRGRIRLRWGQDLYSQYNHMEQDLLGKEEKNEEK